MLGTGTSEIFPLNLWWQFFYQLFLPCVIQKQKSSEIPTVTVCWQLRT